eukprot:14524-Heterococcus_DN1.PRE.2
MSARPLCCGALLRAVIHWPECLSKPLLLMMCVLLLSNCGVLKHLRSDLCCALSSLTCSAAAMSSAAAVLAAAAALAVLRAAKAH